MFWHTAKLKRMMCTEDTRCHLELSLEMPNTFHICCQNPDVKDFYQQLQQQLHEVPVYDYGL